MRSSRDQVYSTFLRAKALSNINLTDNRANFENDTVYFMMNKEVSNDFQIETNLSHSKINYDGGLVVSNFGSVFDDSEVSSLNVRLSNGKSRRGEWYVDSNITETDRVNSDAGDSHYETHDAAFYIPVDKQWDVVLRGGYVNDDLNNIITEVNGSYFAAGFRYFGISKTVISALYGKNFSEAQLHYSVKNRSKIRLSYRDTSVGLLRGSQFDIEVEIKGKRSELRFLKRKSVENLASDTILRLPIQSNFEIDNIPLPDDYYPLPSDTVDILITDFILDRYEVGWGYRGVKAYLGFDLMGGKRKPAGDDVVFQNFDGGKIFLNYDPNKKNQFKFEVSFERSEFPHSSQDSELRQAFASWRRLLNYQFSIAVEAAKLEQKVVSNDLKFNEDRIKVSLKKSF